MPLISSYNHVFVRLLSVFFLKQTLHNLSVNNIFIFIPGEKCNGSGSWNQYFIWFTFTLLYHSDTATSAGCEGPISVGWAVRSRAGPDTDNWIMVVPGKPFLCDGVVTEWHYWGSSSEAFRVIVWRRVFGKINEYEIIGINEIPAGPLGEKVVYSVPVLERIHVLKGDVIGFAFENSLLVGDINPADGVMVRWYKGNQGTPLGITEGDKISFSTGGIRGYSLKAVVDSDKCKLRIFPPILLL